MLQRAHDQCNHWNQCELPLPCKLSSKPSAGRIQSGELVAGELYLFL